MTFHVPEVVRRFWREAGWPLQSAGLECFFGNLDPEWAVIVFVCFAIRD